MSNSSYFVCTTPEVQEENLLIDLFREQRHHGHYNVRLDRPFGKTYNYGNSVARGGFMPDESYAESLRAVIIANGVEVAVLEKIKEMVLLHRQKKDLIRPDDFELMTGSKTDRKWEHRVRASLMDLRRSGECALIGRGKYRFFL